MAEERPDTHKDQWGNDAPVDRDTQRFTKKDGTSGGMPSPTKEDAEKAKTVRLGPAVLKLGSVASAFNVDKAEQEYQNHKGEKYADYDYLNPKGIFTLRNFKKHREEEIESRGWVFSREDEEIMNDPELVEKIEKTLRESSMCCRIDFDYIEDVLNEELKNQFYWYSDHTGGAPAPAERAKTSHDLFGTDIGDSMYQFGKKREWGRSFEKYGSLLSNDLLERFDGSERDYACGYGDSLLEMKPSVRRRTTYTLGDSLLSRALPQLLGGRFDFYTKVSRSKISSPDELRKAKTTRQVAKAIGAGSYIELQYHGHITAQDIDNITAGYSRWNDEQGRRILRMCKSLGIKCYSCKMKYDGSKRIGTVYEITLNDDGTLNSKVVEEKEMKD